MYCPSTNLVFVRDSIARYDTKTDRWQCPTKNDGNVQLKIFIVGCIHSLVYGILCPMNEGQE